jgi:hypothetical protein
MKPAAMPSVVPMVISRSRLKPLAVFVREGLGRKAVAA